MIHSDKCVNYTRALRAKKALEHYAQNKDEQYSPTLTITDILADIAHLCDLEGINFGFTLDMAQMHYESEKEHEEDTNCEEV